MSQRTELEQRAYKLRPLVSHVNREREINYDLLYWVSARFEQASSTFYCIMPHIASGSIYDNGGKNARPIHKSNSLLIIVSFPSFKNFAWNYDEKSESLYFGIGIAFRYTNKWTRENSRIDCSTKYPWDSTSCTHSVSRKHSGIEKATHTFSLNLMELSAHAHSEKNPTIRIRLAVLSTSNIL